MSDLQGASIPALVEEALASARDLATEEVRLVIDEADSQVSSMGRALAFGVTGSVLAGAALSWGGVAVVMALDLGALGAALLSAGGLSASALALWMCRRSIPVPLFALTRARLERRVSNVRDAIQ